MEFQLLTAPAESWAGDAIAAVCFEHPEVDAAAGTLGAEATAAAATSVADPKIAEQSGWLAELRSSGEFTGKLYETAILHRPSGIAAKRLAVIGGGRREKLSQIEARRIGGALARALRSKGARNIAIVLADWAQPGIVRALAEGAILGTWEADKYKTDPKKNDKKLESMTFIASAGDAKAFETELRQGVITGEAQNLTRDLVNEPPNRLTPALLAEATREMAAGSGLECEVLDRERMSELGMGALLGVAQGSSNPPFLIILKYQPSVASTDNHLALIGKGVTFDTGGISIKPADGMEKMKYDMAGAAAVVGAMRAISQLKPPIAVTGYIPTVENMLNGNAQRPSDIVNSLSGKTIEVVNTDAEGRLILADAITYANRNGASHLVDAATLTGAIGIALGHHNMGVFTNNAEFLNRFLAAATAAGEKAWQLPMDEEYKEQLKSIFADLANVGGRPAGSITAAWFLKEFADPKPWVHLDIASTAWLDEVKPWASKGPTGVAVRSFVRLAMDWQRA
ncbi:MAG: leucyl aminopeptidase [Acidobacteriaceae bacterium]|nr:leucyl aminopeptidase [Acidobacteriaceae bacterium]